LINVLTAKNRIPNSDNFLFYQKTIKLSSSESTNSCDHPQTNVDDSDNILGTEQPPDELRGEDLLENSNSTSGNDENSHYLAQNNLNIGSFTDSDVPLKYCCRYLASSYLLAGKQGQLISDKLFRVSVKSLALACIGNIIRLYPNIFLDTLEVITDPNVTNSQMITDIMLFIEHSDPQLRGNTAIIIGLFLNSVYVKYGCSYNEFTKLIMHKNSENQLITLDELVCFMTKALEDESATTCRHALTAVNICLNSLLNSDYDNSHGIRLIHKLLPLSNNIYFLVKINLAQLLSEISYLTIRYLTGNLHFQTKVTMVFIQLLNDNDPRVRHATSNAIIKFVNMAYIEKPNNDEIICKAVHYTKKYLTPIIESNPTDVHSYYLEYKFFIDGMIEPFQSFYKDNCHSSTYYGHIEESLSIIVGMLVEQLIIYPPKHLIYGCFEALCQLSQVYSTTLYPDAWDCRLTKTILADRNTSKIYSSTRSINCGDNFDIPVISEYLSPISDELLSFTLSIITTDCVALDLATHKCMMVLAGNLLSGIALKHLKTMNINDLNDSKESKNKMWNLYEDQKVNDLFQSLFQHVMRMMNIYVHVINDIATVTSSSKSALSSLPNASSLSPRKKISINLDNKIRDRGGEKSSINFLKSGKESIGTFYSLPHYMKLHDLLKAAHLNYKSTLDVDASQMYTGLLNATLEVLSQILEIASTNEAKIVAEEILYYLETTLTLSMTPTIQCVRQLLKSLFGMNLSARWDELEDIHSPDDRVGAKNIDNTRGLYDHCFQKPTRSMAALIKTIGNNCRNSDINETWIIGNPTNSRRRRDSKRKLDMIFKSFVRSNNQKTFFSSFIRIFEPMVIKSLNLYTTTSSVDCQCQVLSLLSQLVQFHVNYCLLDTDKTFIDFVRGQFAFIEESKIPNTEKLLPKIFGFFVHLSYEKFHSKIIIDTREIIKLCDGLMASGQPPMTHCIPAIIPVVRDIFISRSTSSSSLTVSERTELETVREYLISMLLRLINYHPVIDLLAQCLYECRRDDDGEEKWRKWSRSTMDVVLSALAAGKIHIECEAASIAVIKLFATVSPTVFRPVDPLLKVLFTVPPHVIGGESHIKLERWIAMVNIILLSLISYAKEDILLDRLSEMRIDMADLNTFLYLSETWTICNDVDPLNVCNTEKSSSNLPEQKLGIFIFRFLFAVTTKNSHFLRNITNQKQNDDFFFQQLTLFIQLCIHMFESGSHCKIAHAIIAMLNDKIIRIDEINQLMIDISQRSCPLLTTNWIYLMTLLGYSNQTFWTKVLGITNGKNYDVNSATSPSQSQLKSIDTRIISGCATILFCDHICDNLNDTESLSWFMMNHIEDTMKLASELPVKDLVTSAIHRNSAASGLLIQAIAARCLNLSKPSFVKKLLQALECAHEKQSGAVILTIIPKFLTNSYLALSLIAENIAVKRIEILLDSHAEDVIEQLPVADLTRLIETLQTTKLAQQHGALVILLNKLAAKFYDMSPLELEHSRPFNPQTMKNVQLTKTWFMSQVRMRCCNSNKNLIDPHECAQMLRHLDVVDCDDILMSKEFDVRILDECIKLGARLTHDENISKVKFFGTKGNENEARNIHSNSQCLSSLYQSARQCLSSHVRHLNDMMPKPHTVFDPLFIDDDKLSKTIKYVNKFTALMNDEIYFNHFFAIVPTVTSYMRSIEQFNEKDIYCVDPKFDDVDLAKFAAFCLEVIHWMIHVDESFIRSVKPHELELCLNCAEEILRNVSVCHVFGDDKHYSWVCSAANTLSRLIEFWLSPRKTLEQTRDCLPQVDNLGLISALNNDLTKHYARACLQMARLVSWLESNANHQNNKSNIPKFVRDPVVTLIIIISRQKLVNSFVLTPPLVWKHGWHAEGTGPTMCHFPLLLSTNESNLLQELDILRQFIYRITLLGWTSRHQFEEIWMALLSVLSTSTSENKVSYGQLDPLSCNSQATSLAVQGITRLLIQTLLLPHPGSPVNSFMMHHSRDPPLSLQKPASKRLYIVQDLVSWKYECARGFKIGLNTSRNIATDSLDLEQLFTRGNIERDRITNGYDYLSYSQLPVMYLWSSCSLHEDKHSTSVIQLMKKRNIALTKSSLDLTSCVRFLIELYSRWMLSNTPTSSRLIDEVVKSIIAISDLFVERSQFQWMLDTCWNIERLYPAEDEILHHSLIFAICKAAAVLVPLDIDNLEKVKRVTDIGLKSTHISCRIATLHGILYLLQSAVHANCDETMNAIHPIAIKYIQSHLDAKKMCDILSNENEEHHRMIWALVFFLFEHTEDTTVDADVPAILELAFSLAIQPNISIAIHRTLLYGLERLIATRSVMGRIADQIVKLSLDRMKQPSLFYIIPALRLLLTCMYSEAADRFNRNALLNEDQPLPDIEPEALMCTIERTSAIFDRIKRGHSRDAKILCVILSEILGDFFPPFETLTKVIGEFLSPQQPHQQLISGVVFKVCERVAGNAEQLTLLQDWVLFSLPNFIESLPLITSTWCLSCFFVSASTNQWLRALFPYVQSRMGKYEFEDKKILYVAALDFYRQLSNESQRKVFMESFSSAENEPGSPFNDIVKSFQDTSDD
ncbi:hypothetical protein PV326_009203, partial [Microctonus aethiopoides]